MAESIYGSTCIFRDPQVRKYKNLIKIVKIKNVAMSKLVMGDTNVSFVV